MIIKDTIRDLVAADINGRCIALSDINTENISRKIENSFFKKYQIDLKSMLGKKFYRINTRGELKFAIDDAKDSTSNVSGMKTYLKDNYRIDMKTDGKEYFFKHPEEQNFLRGSSLGKSYEAKSISGHFLEKYRKGKNIKKNSRNDEDRLHRALERKDLEKGRSRKLSMER